MTRARWAAALTTCLLSSGLGACAPGPSQPQDVLEVLAASERAGDAFTDSAAQVPEGLVAGSQRSAGQTEAARYWAAVGTDGEVCLVGFLTGTAPTYAITCAAPADFAAGGLQLGVSAGGAAADAWLVPDDYDTAALESQGYRSAAANLLTRP